MGAFMFTRNSSTEPKLNGNQQPTQPPRKSGLVEKLSQQQERSEPVETGNLSIISNDLRIIGQGLQIISRGTLQVDGEVEGDVAGTEIIIGELGQVRGTVAAERVTVHGKISGVIRAVSVSLQSSARVEGDIHHMSIMIEQGAVFDGRCRRPSDASELNLALDSDRPVRN
jgi:cytoskeletal protein CcmA (bactofilin family)